MTRKDYVKTATILNSFKDFIADEYLFEDLVNDFSDMFKADNERFDSMRFAEACNKEVK